MIDRRKLNVQPATRNLKPQGERLLFWQELEEVFPIDTRHLNSPLPLTARNASGTVAQIYAEVRKTRAIAQLTLEVCIHR